MNPNFNNSDRDMIFNLQSSETDRLSNFGYKTNSKLTEGLPENVLNVDGTTMLIGQAISSFNLWTAQEIKFDHVYHEILERLNNED